MWESNGRSYHSISVLCPSSRSDSRETELISRHSLVESLEQQLLFEQRAIQIEFRLSVLAENISETQGIAGNSAEQPSLNHIVHSRRPATIAFRVFIGQRIKLLAIFFHFEQLQMQQRIFFDGRIGRRIVNVLPQKHRGCE